MTWAKIFKIWPLVESDLHSEYGIDTESGILGQRSFRWFLNRLNGLLATDSRTYRSLFPPKNDKHKPRGKRR